MFDAIALLLLESCYRCCLYEAHKVIWVSEGLLYIYMWTRCVSIGQELTAAALDNNYYYYTTDNHMCVQGIFRFSASHNSVGSVFFVPLSASDLIRETINCEWNKGVVWLFVVVLAPFFPSIDSLSLQLGWTKEEEEEKKGNVTRALFLYIIDDSFPGWAGAFCLWSTRVENGFQLMDSITVCCSKN